MQDYANSSTFTQKTKHMTYDMRSPQKTRLKSKRNLKNLNQNVQNPKKRFKQI